MSDPYNQYNQYPQNQYSSPAPGQGYAPPQGGYHDPNAHPPHQQQYPPQQAGYPPQQGYQDPYAQQQASYGPPAQGGFQHGQTPTPAPYQDANARGQNDYQQYPSAPPANQFPQQGPYHHDQAPYDPNNPNPYGQAPPAGGYGATDPNAQAEGDRGLMGALAGGVAGHYGGNKMGGHGILGAIAGAVAGSKLEDQFKSNKHKQSGQGGNYGGY
jgi:hypothetical protein